MIEKSTKMEEIFDDIIPYEEYEDEQSEHEKNSDMTKRNESEDKRNELMEQLSTIEKIELALEKVSDLDELDDELDAIATQALQSYSELFDKAGNFADAHAGKAYEVSAQLLKIALDAKDSKLNRKLKTIDMQLKKAKLEADERKNAASDDAPEQQALSKDDILDVIKEMKGDEGLSEKDFQLDRENARGTTRKKDADDSEEQ